MDSILFSRKKVTLMHHQITGILKQRWNRNPGTGMRCDLELLLEATSIKTKNEEKANLDVPEKFLEEVKDFWRRYRQCPLRGRDFIIRSMCPEVNKLAHNVVSLPPMQPYPVM
eukprot:Plantae.Rhodophyta-Purpureofilum_apyrenoidigerum.ctg45564.p1 GENE.Plantae.Rhodophyta-Purpureofilum_apyrenoidigerum.ctg45564~~Plantae.Rhodophyta-Purpureofilum_apyrenoidigerum.ctg45564.p1  ORF type:complete len:113 (+),score=11.90 Plantae.Rhodophyta-Purpureofilum_apyrenoidigerum.ctg45564:10-348(+)